VTITLLFLALLVGQHDGSRQADPAAHLPSWAQAGRCGPNCLYSMIQIMRRAGMSGYAPTYEEVIKCFPQTTGPDGFSMADLSTAAFQLGLTLEVRKVSTEDFGELPTPFVAHLDVLNSGGVGHFITVCDVVNATSGPTNVSYIDGSTGQLHNSDFPTLKKSLSGFVLTSPRHLNRQPDRLFSVGALLSGLVIGALGGAFASRQRGEQSTSLPSFTCDTACTRP